MIDELGNIGARPGPAKLPNLQRLSAHVRAGTGRHDVLVWRLRAWMLRKVARLHFEEIAFLLGVSGRTARDWVLKFENELEQANGAARAAGLSLGTPRRATKAEFYDRPRDS